MAERLRQGWALGSSRDDAHRRHPALVAWDALPEEQREKDRQVVCSLPSMLADAGLDIARTEPEAPQPADARPTGHGPTGPRNTSPPHLPAEIASAGAAL